MLFSKRKDKRGVIGIIIFFIILFTILIVGFIGVLVTGIIDYTSDTITPELTNIGLVEGANLSQGFTNTIGVVNTMVQALPWILLLGYGMALVFSIVFVVAFRTNPHPIFVALYVAFILLLILGAIIMSNAYQDIYEGTDEIALRLQEQTAMSYLILYSPFILAVVAFIAGVFVFASPKEGGGIDV